MISNASPTWHGFNGAAHFVKMVHNGIEYGPMAALAEGLNSIRNANVGKHHREIDAEATPWHPEHFLYDINVKYVAEAWRRGSVVGLWLLDLAAAALRQYPDPSNFQGRLPDSVERRWTVQAAVDEGIPAPVISATLYSRFSSRGGDKYTDRLLSALRYEFGGHLEQAKTGERQCTLFSQMHWYSSGPPGILRTSRFSRLFRG